MEKRRLIMAAILMAATAQLASADVPTRPHNVPTPQENSMDIQDMTAVSFNLRMTGRIGGVDNAKMTLRGTTGTLTYRMGGKTVRSTLKVDTKRSRLDRDGFGHLEVISYDGKGKKKGTFVGESDVCEAGFIFEGTFVNVSGATTEFLFTE